MRWGLVLLGLAACGKTTAGPADSPADAATSDASTPVASVPDAATSASCVLDQSSTLTGVTIKLTTTSCTFTLAQAKAGITIAYEVDIAANVTGVVPGGQSSGPRIGPSGLDVFENLSGNGQHYCLCDVGLGPALPTTPVTLNAGSYPSTFQWDGHNWYGPSDTGTPKGALFPTGDYVLEVSAIGKKDGVAFTVSSKFRIQLVP